MFGFDFSEVIVQLKVHDFSVNLSVISIIDLMNVERNFIWEYLSGKGGVNVDDNGGVNVEEKKVEVKKVKKAKVTVTEVAITLDADDLATFL